MHCLSVTCTGDDASFCGSAPVTSAVGRPCRRGRSVKCGSATTLAVPAVICLRCWVSLSCSIPIMSRHLSASQDGRYPLDAEAAATVASVVAAIRGAGKPHTEPADCRSLNGAFFADLYHVRS